MASSVPQLQLVRRHQLSPDPQPRADPTTDYTRFPQSDCVGVSDRIWVLEYVDHLADEEYKSFLNVRVPSLTEEPLVKRPDNLKKRSDKYHLPDGRWAVREPSGTTTYLLSEDMASVRRMYDEDYGRLRGVAPGGLLYFKEVASNEYNLSIFSPEHVRLAILRQAVNDNRISVCCHPSSSQFAITCTGGNTLHIYASPTSLPQQVGLSYVPRALNGVTATEDAIFVVGQHPAELYVHDWRGKKLRQIPASDLGVEEEYLQAIGRVGDQLIVAAGSFGCVKALYVFSLT